MAKERTYYAVPGISFDTFFRSHICTFCKGMATQNKSFTFDEIYAYVKKMFGGLPDTEYEKMQQKIKENLSDFVERGYLTLDENGNYSNYHNENWP